MSDLELIAKYIANLKKDLKEDKIDLHFARVEAKSILTKATMLLEKTNETDENHSKLVSIIDEVKKMISNISHNIEIEDKQERLFKDSF